MKKRIANWWDPRTWVAFAFWELRTILKGYQGDDLADWSATGFLIVVEILGLGALSSAWSVYNERRLFDNDLLLITLGVLVLNVGAAWGGNRRRQQFSREFEGYPMPIKVAGGIVVVALIVLTVAAASHFGAAYSRLPRQ